MKLLRNRNFLLHWISGFIAQTGSFFSIVAMPWLVLGITNNNPFIMSTVLAAGSLPQAFFLLFGGVLSDRFSSLQMLLITRAMLVIAIFSLALWIYFDITALWMLYIYTFSIGVLSALAIPASQALLPSIIEKRYLAVANGMVIGSVQIAQIVGPVCAGWIIWYAKSFAGTSALQLDTTAIAVAFTVDAVCISIAVLLMLLIRVPQVATNVEQKNIRLMFSQGVAFCWRNKGIATVLIYLALISFFLHGVLMAALPLFTKVHLGLGEKSYGNLYAMVGIGAIAGIIVGSITKPSAKRLGLVVLICDLVNAFALLGLSAASDFNHAAFCLLFMGVCGGIVMVAGTVWFQQRTPEHLMGRVIGILMFSVIGLVPISASITGALMIQFPCTLIMSGAGVIIVLAAAIGLTIPRVRLMGDVPLLDSSRPAIPR